MQRFLVDFALRRYLPRRHRATVMTAIFLFGLVRKSVLGKPTVVFRQELLPGESLRISTKRVG